MFYKTVIGGTAPIIQHCGISGLDKRSAVSIEIAAITSKKGSNRTIVDEERLVELETIRSLWLDAGGKVTIPASALRAAVEAAARKSKQGPLVREGFMIDSVLEFRYDEANLGSTVEELGRTVSFSVPVVVSGSRIVRTRAKFDEWACAFVAECDDELVDKDQLLRWLSLAGRRIGLGDWRPQKSGHYGRFEVLECEGSEERWSE